ncbi:MAG TPA: hypothetical protein VFK69_01315 [Candidatus Eisenbacteria bacterium]|nr:hypothetical protein [Candidatus Eisenbacteria bacterium]
MSPADQEWPRGWEEAERAQRRLEARLTFIEKLAWLEETQRLVEHMQRARAGRVNDADRERP